MTELGFAGNGWGAIAALSGLLKSFNEVYVVSSDPEVLHLVDTSYHRKSIEELPQTILFSGYTEILSTSFIKEHNCINIHYSLLPKYRGLHSTVWAILNDEEELGYTIHLIDEEIDHGDIIHQSSFLNDGKSSAPDYIKTFNKHVEQNLAKIIMDYLSGKITPRPQDHSKASWVGKRKLKDCRIEFSRDSRYISNLFRCLQAPYPPPHIVIDEQLLEIGEMRVHPVMCDTHIGRVLNVDDKWIYVKCKDAYILLANLTLQGEKYDHRRIKIGINLNSSGSS